jgi:hypothetical protein
MIWTKAATTMGTILAAVALAACGGSDGGGSKPKSGLSEKVHTDYLAGCKESGQSTDGCECLYDELTGTQGIDTEQELKDLATKIQEAQTSSDPAGSAPKELKEAALACKDELQQ